GQSGTGGDGSIGKGCGPQQPGPFFPEGEDAHPEIKHLSDRRKREQIMSTRSIFQCEHVRKYVRQMRCKAKSRICRKAPTIALTGVPAFGRQIRNPRQAAGISYTIKYLFRFLLVTFLELVDTAGRVNQYVLPGKEGMRSVGNFQFDQGVFAAVFPLDGLPALSRRFAQKGFAITHVFKNNEPVTLGVDILFHNLFCLKVVRIWPYRFFKVCTFGLLTKFSPAVQTALSGLRPMDPWSIFGQRRYAFLGWGPNKSGSAPHIYILQRDTQVGAGTELNHGLQII